MRTVDVDLISNPEAKPKEGDWICKKHGNSIVKAEYHEPIVKTPDECYKNDKRVFDSQRVRLFIQSEWVRQRHGDLIELGLPDLNWTAWLNYWQVLRDLPQQADFDPANPNWPDKPSEASYE